MPTYEHINTFLADYFIHSVTLDKSELPELPEEELEELEIAKKNSIDISKLFSIKVTLNESHIAAASYEKNLNE